MDNSILAKNKEGWDAIADDWFGTTALPVYGVLCPDETGLDLFGDVKDKKVLDIGCGSGHSLKYLADRGVGELWGLDISTKQIENADKMLKSYCYDARLFNAPMESNPGLPIDYFDVVYSIYAIGWTVDLSKTFTLIASYLKTGGEFIFSWDHPLMHCVDFEGDKLVFSGEYLITEPYSWQKGGKTLYAYNRRMSDYINALADAGFKVERLIEETDMAALDNASETKSQYYSPLKAEKFPLSFIIKARKL